MSSPENATSVSLRPEGVDADGRKIPGQKEFLVSLRKEKLFQLSPFVQDCLEILEKHPELRDAARPGLELARALDRAEIADAAMAMLADAVSVMEESQGIAGWHLNGEIASWEKALPGFLDEYAALVARRAPRER